MSGNTRKDFAYRQLENNLIYISESIIQAFNSNKCDLSVWTEEAEPGLYMFEVNANLEKSFIELAVYFSWPNNMYVVRVWDKNSGSSEKDKKIWSRKENCPGKLVLNWSDEDLSSEQGFQDFDSGLHRLVYEYVKKIQDFYLSSGGVSPEIKNLL